MWESGKGAALSYWFLEGVEWVYSFIWDGPLLVLLLGVSLFLTLQLRGLSFTKLPHALRLALWPQKGEDDGEGDISHFQSLMTALAATIGIGNIAGVATAISVGGLGAVFWIWVVGLLGMATKYVEAYLAIQYRIVDKKGEMAGGPMYFIEKGMGCSWLAKAFAIFGALAAVGGGNLIQANSVADVFQNHLHVDPRLTGILLAALTGITLYGGVKSVGRVASVLVPFMAGLYFLGGLVVLGLCYDQVPAAFYSILEGAWTGKAAMGGAAGGSVWLAFRVGVSRGLCSSEAGLGTASIAAAAARTKNPETQALVSMTGTFLSTILMCTLTALVIGVSGILNNPQGMDGASLTTAAFDSVLPGQSWVVTVGLVLFAYSTILGWGYYGEKCVEYLWDERSVGYYRFFFTLAVLAGAVMELSLVWRLADITNALMALPNLIGLWVLRKQVVPQSKPPLVRPSAGPETVSL